MKKIYLIPTLLSLLSCSNKNNPYFSNVNYANANRQTLNGKSKIVQKPTMIKMGITPLSLNEARPYMINVFKMLIPELEKTNITYQMAGYDIILTIQSHIILDNKMNILSSIKPQLDKIINVLVLNNRNYIEIVGHTSSIGSSYKNLIKSKDMAISVAKHFMDNGIIPERIFMTGMGESHWIAPNDTNEGRYLNNRIEIKISPII